jgi:hypothetical protein
MSCNRATVRQVENVQALISLNVYPSMVLVGIFVPHIEPFPKNGLVDLGLLIFFKRQKIVLKEECGFH